MTTNKQFTASISALLLLWTGCIIVDPGETTEGSGTDTATSETGTAEPTTGSETSESTSGTTASETTASETTDATGPTGTTSSTTETTESPTTDSETTDATDTDATESDTGLVYPYSVRYATIHGAPPELAELSTDEGVFGPDIDSWSGGQLLIPGWSEWVGLGPAGGFPWEALDIAEAGGEPGDRITVWSWRTAPGDQVMSKLWIDEGWQPLPTQTGITFGLATDYPQMRVYAFDPYVFVGVGLAGGEPLHHSYDPGPLEIAVGTDLPFNTFFVVPEYPADENLNAWYAMFEGKFQLFIQDNDGDIQVVPPVECGNGVLEGSLIEECDGADLGGQDCMTGDMGYDSGELACDDECKVDYTGCTWEHCGDGVAQQVEACDGDDLNGFTCESFGQSGNLGCLPTCQDFDLSDCN